MKSVCLACSSQTLRHAARADLARDGAGKPRHAHERGGEEGSRTAPKLTVPMIVFFCRCCSWSFSARPASGLRIHEVTRRGGKHPPRLCESGICRHPRQDLQPESRLPFPKSWNGLLYHARNNVGFYERPDSTAAVFCERPSRLSICRKYATLASASSAGRSALTMDSASAKRPCRPTTNPRF